MFVTPFILLLHLCNKAFEKGGLGGIFQSLPHLIHFDADIHEQSNYSQQILNYQFTMPGYNVLTLIGGDTNHSQNVDQIGLIGARDYPTQVGGIDIDGSLRTRRLPTTRYIMQYPKRYDGFFAGPSALNRRIVATELKGMWFRKRVGDGRIFANYLDPATEYPAASVRRGVLAENEHIHPGGHHFSMALGWPYMPGRIKLFFIKMLELASTEIRYFSFARAVLTAGAPRSPAIFDTCSQGCR